MRQPYPSLRTPVCALFACLACSLHAQPATAQLDESIARHPYYAWVQTGGGYQTALVDRESGEVREVVDALLVAPYAEVSLNDDGSPRLVSGYDLMEGAVLPETHTPVCAGHGGDDVEGFWLRHFARRSLEIGRPFALERFEGSEPLSRKEVSLLGNVGPWLMIRECWTRDECGSGPDERRCQFVIWNIEIGAAVPPRRASVAEAFPGICEQARAVADVFVTWDRLSMFTFPTDRWVPVALEVDFVDGRAEWGLHFTRDVDGVGCVAYHGETWRPTDEVVVPYDPAQPTPYDAFARAPDTVNAWWSSFGPGLERRGWSDPVPPWLVGR